jgi:autotransporter-associated beta strand protein
MGSGALGALANAIRGGDGGIGGYGYFYGGGGGSGGVGLLLLDSANFSVTNSIRGGDGGLAGAFVASGCCAYGAGGAGGIGIVGSNLTITNRGTITGGYGGNGIQADAISFLSGANSLTLSDATGAGTIIGNISVTGLLSLNSGVFGPAVLNNVITGTGSLRISTNDTLTLGGTNSFTGGTTFAGGTLVLGSIGALGSAGALSFEGGTLQFSSSNTTDYSGRFSSAANQQFRIDTNNQNLTFASPLSSSSGSLIKSGTGTLTLTAANTYSGGTSITGGTLQIGDGGMAGSIVGNVTNNGTLVFNRSDSITFGGVISGNGALTKTGAATLELTGANTYTGGTTVSSGNLRINGSLASAVTVQNGATLSGAGTINSAVTVQSGGTLAPGNSIGTLTVQGNLVMTAASTYMVEVTPNSADRVNVTGTATLGGATVNASFAPGAYVEKKYTIVNAAGGVTGTFGTQVNTNLPTNFASRLSYDASNAYLELTMPLPTSISLNQNQAAVGNALVGFFNRAGGIPLVFGALDAKGLSQASGELGASSQQTTFDAMGIFMSMMTDPFTAGRGNDATGVTAYADEALRYAGKRKPTDAFAAITKALPVASVFQERWNVWAAGFGGSRGTDGNTVTGSNNATSSLYGTAVGADYWFSPSTIAGFSLAGGGTNFSVNGGGSGRSDLFQAGAFVRHTVGSAYVTAAAAYGWQDITTDRTVAAAGFERLRANFNAHAYSGRVEAGSRFTTPWLWGVGLTPYGAVQVTALDLPSYAETGTSGATTFALAYAGKSVTSMRTELGLRSDKSFVLTDAILTLRGRAAWAHDYNPDRNVAATFQALPGASFVVNGAAQARNAALATASAEMEWMNGWSIAGTFEGEFSDVTQSYAGKGALRYSW